MIEEIDSDESLNGTRLDLLLASREQLSKQNAVECRRCDAQIK